MLLYQCFDMGVFCMFSLGIVMVFILFLFVVIFLYKKRFLAEIVRFSNELPLINQYIFLKFILKFNIINYLHFKF